MPDRIQVKTLGSMRVYQGEQEIDPRLWVSIKARDLLAYFVTFRHESIPLDRALEALWTEPDRGSKTAFHTALYRLRKALRVAQELAKYVLVEAGDYRLDLARFEVDVDMFDKLYKQAQRAHGSEAVECYQSALDLYDGEYLNNLYYDWLLPERVRLTEAYVSGLGRTCPPHRAIWRSGRSAFAGAQGFGNQSFPRERSLRHYALPQSNWRSAGYRAAISLFVRSPAR